MTSPNQWLKQAYNGVLDLIYPPICLVCGAEMAEGCLCSVCIGKFEAVAPPFCERCGVPISSDRMVCLSCELSEPPFVWTYALGKYDGSLRRAIHRMKFDRKSALAKPLGNLLADSLNALPSFLFSQSPAFDCVVPVPLHLSRLKKRGFNQSERLAGVVAQKRGWQLDTHNLRRTQFTRPQASVTDRSERLANIAGAFEAADPVGFQGRSVLLVDDVLTTLGTARECARVLKNAGAKRVCVAALARG
jgi:competence protein ComFC